MNVAAIVSLCASVISITITDDGRHGWDQKSILYAEVAEVTALPATEWGPTHQFRLRPEATLTGSFDSAVEPEILVTGTIGIGRSFAMRPPQPRDHVAIVVIRQSKGSYIFPGAYTTYMPLKRPICVVKDFSDPKIAELRGTLRELRVAPSHPN